MLPTEDFGVKEAVSLAWCRLCIGLSSDFDALVVEERDVFWNEGVVKRI